MIFYWLPWLIGLGQILAGAVKMAGGTFKKVYDCIIFFNGIKTRVEKSRYFGAYSKYLKINNHE